MIIENKYDNTRYKAIKFRGNRDGLEIFPKNERVRFRVREAKRFDGEELVCAYRNEEMNEIMWCIKGYYIVRIGFFEYKFFSPPMFESIFNVIEK